MRYDSFFLFAFGRMLFSPYSSSTPWQWSCIDMLSTLLYFWLVFRRIFYQNDKDWISARSYMLSVYYQTIFIWSNVYLLTWIIISVQIRKISYNFVISENGVAARYMHTTTIYAIWSLQGIFMICFIVIYPPWYFLNFRINVLPKYFPTFSLNYVLTMLVDWKVKSVGKVLYPTQKTFIAYYILKCSIISYP